MFLGIFASATPCNPLCRYAQYDKAQYTWIWDKIILKHKELDKKQVYDTLSNCLKRNLRNYEVFFYFVKPLVILQEALIERRQDAQIYKISCACVNRILQ